ncbi:hypothetical protein, partial [Streptomyces parvus]
LVAEQRFGGGPGEFGPVFDSAYADLTGHADWLRVVREAQDAADRELAAGLAALTGSCTRSPGDGGVR